MLQMIAYPLLICVECFTAVDERRVSCILHPIERRFLLVDDLIDSFDRCGGIFWRDLHHEPAKHEECAFVLTGRSIRTGLLESLTECGVLG